MPAKPNADDQRLILIDGHSLIYHRSLLVF